METKKQSWGIISIIGSVIVFAFAGAVGKSCGKSLVPNHITAKHVTPAPPSRNELKEYDVLGLRLLLPGSPEQEKIELPLAARNVIKSVKNYTVSDRSMKVGISYAMYVNPEVNLDGSANGATAGVRNLPSVRSFTSSTKETTIAGMAGRETTMNYMNSKFQIDHFGLVFARGGECWQISIIGEGSQNRAELENLKNVIFESIKLTSVN